MRPNQRVSFQSSNTRTNRAPTHAPMQIGPIMHSMILQEGILSLRNAKGQWKKRYFVLKSDGVLTYFKKRGGAACGGLFLSADWYVADSLIKANGFQLSNLDDKVYYMAADSLRQRVAWMVKLANLITALASSEQDHSEATLESPKRGSAWTLVRLKLQSVLEMEAQIASICERLSQRDERDEMWSEQQAEGLVDERLKRTSMRWERVDEGHDDEEVDETKGAAAEDAEAAAAEALAEAAADATAEAAAVVAAEAAAEAAEAAAAEAAAEAVDAAAGAAATAFIIAVMGVAAEAASAEAAAAEAAVDEAAAVSDTDDEAAAMATGEEVAAALDRACSSSDDEGSAAGDEPPSAIMEGRTAAADGASPPAQAAALASVWERKAEVAASESRANPFSSAFERGAAARPRKGDADYGRARKGSLTEARAAAALAWVEEEIGKLVGVIEQHGTPDAAGRPTICFGPLFELYASISDTLVGILMRARKRGQVAFEADMLFQGVHDRVPITLLSAGAPRPRGGE